MSSPLSNITGFNFLHHSINPQYGTRSVSENTKSQQNENVEQYHVILLEQRFLRVWLPLLPIVVGITVEACRMNNFLVSLDYFCPFELSYSRCQCPWRNTDSPLNRIDQWLNDSATASISPTTGQPRWHPILADISHPLGEESNGIFTTDQFRPTTPSYFNLIPTCIDLFYEHIYPIMPLIYIPALREAVSRPLEMYEKNLLYALCALTSTHMSGKSIQARGPPCWEAAGRFFLDECILVRQSYDFVEDKTLWAVISSYLVHTAFFEINQNRKSWYYLREAMTMGQDIGLHDEKSYIGLSPEEQLCRRRTFWILYVTER